MNVIVTCEFFDLQDKKPRHIGDVLTVSKERYSQLLSEGLVELYLDNKSSDTSASKNKKNKQKDDNQAEGSKDDNQAEDSKSADSKDK